MERKKVLLMYSGGKDSVACIVKLIGEGYEVHLINFDNGCMHFGGLESRLAMTLESIYPQVKWVGITTNLVQLRDNKLHSDSILFSKFASEYGDFTPNQLQCLNCRTAMYRVAIVYAVQNGIKYIAEGARKEQMFAIEQEPMKIKYEELCREFGIELLWPVWLATDVDIYHLHCPIINAAMSSGKITDIPWYNNFVRGEGKCMYAMPFNSDEGRMNQEDLQGLIDEQAKTAENIFLKL